MSEIPIELFDLKPKRVGPCEVTLISNLLHRASIDDVLVVGQSRVYDVAVGGETSTPLRLTYTDDGGNFLDIGIEDNLTYEQVAVAAISDAIKKHKEFLANRNYLRKLTRGATAISLLIIGSSFTLAKSGHDIMAVIGAWGSVPFMGFGLSKMSLVAPSGKYGIEKERIYRSELPRLSTSLDAITNLSR